MMDKQCHVKSCNGYPLYGFGLSRSPQLRWACAQHRNSLVPAASQNVGMGAGGGDTGNAPPPALPSKAQAAVAQGRLL